MIARLPEERAGLIEAGKRLGEVLAKVAGAARSGISSAELETLAERLIREKGDTPAFLGYTPDSAKRPYPATLCVSINDEVVHGIPNESPRTLKEGDIVGLDLGLIHDGLIVDSALTVPIGAMDDAASRLLAATRQALEAGIKAAQVGARVGDISHAIETAISGTGFSVVKALGGHGVGKSVHEEPFVPNTGHSGTGPELVEGMALALEPIVNEGKAIVVLGSDGYTYRTKDGSRSAHFEHTIVIEKGGPLVVTRRPDGH